MITWFRLALTSCLCSERKRLKWSSPALTMMRSGSRLGLRWLLALLGLALAGGIAFLSLGRWVSTGAAAPVSADVIVALGGDDGGRVSQSGLLHRAGYAPFLMLTAAVVRRELLATLAIMGIASPEVM